MSVSGASMSQKGPAIFQEPECIKKGQFQSQEIFNFCLILEFEIKLLSLIYSTHFTATSVLHLPIATTAINHVACRAKPNQALLNTTATRTDIS
jgi:hypothetical protein